MNKEDQKSYSYLDEFKVIKTLGSGYNAVYLFFYDLESSSVKIKKASL